MLVRSVIYGWGFDFMRPFQIKKTPHRVSSLFMWLSEGFELI